VTERKQDETRGRTMPTLPRRRGSRRMERPLQPPAKLQTREWSRLDRIFLLESGLRMSRRNKAGSHGRCATNQLRAMARVRPRRRHPRFEQAKRIFRRVYISRPAGISWNSSLSPRSVRTRRSASWIVIVSSSITRIIQSFSCLRHSASREANLSVGLDKFIAIVIAFGRLSLRDNGILHGLDERKLFSDNEKLTKRRVPQGVVRIQHGNKLKFGGNKETGTFTVTLGEVISHEPSLVGRATAVLHGTSSNWKKRDLVVKISWPGSNRAVESELLREATSKANSTIDNEWALNHLPKVLYAQDVVFDSDSTYERVASLFDDAKIDNGEYTYERRTLRIIIQERLYPLKELTKVKDVGQVLLDVACGMLLRFAR
jgi:hypothetical protein